MIKLAARYVQYNNWWFIPFGTWLITVWYSLIGWKKHCYHLLPMDKLFSNMVDVLLSMTWILGKLKWAEDNWDRFTPVEYRTFWYSLSWGDWMGLPFATTPAWSGLFWYNLGWDYRYPWFCIVVSGINPVESMTWRDKLHPNFDQYLDPCLFLRKLSALETAFISRKEVSSSQRTNWTDGHGTGHIMSYLWFANTV